ncbi:MAG: hypothetical protein GY788_07460 [bacterium]|nr:hypothetical protein [bacterium]
MMDRTDLTNQIEEMDARIEKVKNKLANRPDASGAERWKWVIEDPMVNHLRALLKVMGPSAYEGADIDFLMQEIEGYDIDFMLEKFQRHTA